jgi:toxin ParE1/3/4
MMEIIWTELALFDLDQAREYILEVSPSAAAQTVDRIEQSLKTLQSFPEIGRLGRVPGTRELVIPTTPFILPYRIQPNHIEILAVIHGAQKWDDRF